MHQRYFGRPGATLLGADSHTPAAGALGMLAIGAGGLDVATAIAGEPFRMAMPAVWGVRLTGALPHGVSAKDVILEMLRRHGVAGGNGRIVEYHGPGLDALSAMDRHVIANMGTELGAVTTVFPSDAEVRRFLESEGRGDAWREILADEGATYDHHEEIDLSRLEPLIAKPSSPGNVVPVSEVAGEDIYQVYIGSSANPGFRDFAVVAEMVRGQHPPHCISLDINPTTRDLVADLARTGHLFDLMSAGARLHQAGCNGCIGMGQAPATGRNSLRTVPRNFPGRSGTPEDSVFLCSPETAAASALAGRIADPRERDWSAEATRPPEEPTRSLDALERPWPEAEARKVTLVKGRTSPLCPNSIRCRTRWSYRSCSSRTTTYRPTRSCLRAPRCCPSAAISREFVFRDVDPDYVGHAKKAREAGGHAVVGGRNYGQGSSREHAVLAPRHLGLRAVVAESIARIHRSNLINYGILPLIFADPGDRGRCRRNAKIRLGNLLQTVREGGEVDTTIDGERITLKLDLSDEEREILAAGGRVNRFRRRVEV